MLELPEVQTVRSTDFWKKASQRTWIIIQKLQAAGRDMDVMTVGDEVRRVKGVKDLELDAIELMDATSRAPTTLHAAEHAKRG